MTQRERLEAVISGKEPDYTPAMGGWVACPEHILKIANVSEEAYWDDPIAVSIQAYRKLQVDGLIAVAMPLQRGDFRVVNIDTYRSK